MKDESDKYKPDHVQQRIKQNIEKILRRGSSKSNTAGETDDDSNEPIENPQHNEAPEEPSSDENNNNTRDNENGNGNEEPDPEDEYNYGNPGISSAYGEKKRKKEKEPKAAKTGGEPPKHPKIKSSSGETDIMKAIWNEIVSFYEACLDTAMDTVLDFADWVFFESYKPSEKTAKKEEDEKKTPADYGRELLKRYIEHSEQFLTVFNQAHKELKGNANKEEAGLPPKWETWQEQPEFYEKFKDVYSKAKADENSPEAKVMKIFDKAPEVEHRIQSKKLFLLSIAINLAVLDEIKNPTKINIPANIVKNIKDIEMLVNDRSISSSDELKEKVINKLNKIQTLDETSEENKELNKTISALERVARSDETNREKLGSLLKEKITAVKDVDSPLRKMEKTSEDYYGRIFKNVERIRNACQNDPDKTKVTIQAYIKHCQSIYEDKKNKENTIDNFILDGRRIGDFPEPNMRGTPSLRDNRESVFPNLFQRFKNASTRRA